MKLEALFSHTFKAIRHQLGLDRRRDHRPLWQQTLRTDSVFCQALVAEGYLHQEQMLHAANRYRLGRTRDGGVIFWQIDQHGVERDGKVMYYRPDCHRDHDHHPDWVSAILENRATPSQKARKIDLVDFLFVTQIPQITQIF